MNAGIEAVRAYQKSVTNRALALEVVAGLELLATRDRMASLQV